MVKVALKLEQRTKLSQIQRLTIKMLTLRSQELTDFLHEQVAENPLLDIRYGDVKSQADAGKEKPLDAVRSRADSLEESLMKQLRLQTLPRPVLLAAGLVIRSLDEKGFCTGNLAELGQEYALDGATMDKGLAVVQSLDPPGIGARDIRECLLLQTRRHGQAPAGTERLLSQYYEDFLQGKWQKLQHEMDLSEKDFKAIRDFLKTLALQPASTADAETEFIRPDVEIYEEEPGKLAVRSLEELPDVFFRDDLYKEYEAQGDKKTRTYIHRARPGLSEPAIGLGLPLAVHFFGASMCGPVSGSALSAGTALAALAAKGCSLHDRPQHSYGKPRLSRTICPLFRPRVPSAGFLCPGLRLSE